MTEINSRFSGREIKLNKVQDFGHFETVSGIVKSNIGDNLTVASFSGHFLHFVTARVDVTTDST